MTGKEMKVDLVRVSWLDHANVSGWQDSTCIDDFKPCLVTTVGFLIKEDKKTLYISSSYCSESGEVNATMLIVKSCITKRKVLYKIEF